MAKKQRAKTGKRGFYGPALDEAACLKLEEAAGMEGLDQEIALLRFRLCELIEKSPEACELHLKIISQLINNKETLGNKTCFLILLRIKTMTH